MAFNRHRLMALAALAAMAGTLSAPASATFLYWSPPDFAGAPVQGDEPGIGLPLPGATPKELRAHLLWNLRAGLNVAALNCQFAPSLLAVRNYNEIIKGHGKELTDAYTAVSGYFKRTGGKTWQKSLDQYTTRTYNGFSPNHAQIGFCETAGVIAREALTRRKGELYMTAIARMQEFRNSLIVRRDGIYAFRPVLGTRSLPSLDPKCWDRKDNYNMRKCGTPYTV